MKPTAERRLDIVYRQLALVWVVVLQMLPPAGSGLIVTIVILLRHPIAIELLPIVWLTLFGLGVPFASARIRNGAGVCPGGHKVTCRAAPGEECH